MSDDEKDEVDSQANSQANSDLNKFEVRDPVVEALLTTLAGQIQSRLPGNFRFSLFLFQELEDEQESLHIFYCSSLKTADSLPLVELWCRRQVH